MTEMTIYIADDGTSFEDEWDCRHYEWQQNFEDGKPLFQMLDVGKDRLDPMDAESYEDAYFLFFSTHEAIQQCQEVWDCDMVDAYVPYFLNPSRHHHTEIDCGLWAYDENTEEWYHLGKRIEELTKLANDCLVKINGGV